MARITPERSRKIFHDPIMPSVVMEKQFDGFDDELRALATTDWHEIKDSDLWYYIHDLSYMELQTDLFQYLFPVCLNFWHTSLMRNSAAAVGDAEFHHALYRGDVLDKMVTKSQLPAIFKFFHDGFIERIEVERGFQYCGSRTPAYSFIYRLNSLGCIVPIIKDIWTSWWGMNSCGKAVSAVMYASGLIYLEDENPIFGKWTCTDGGGGPYLTENDSDLCDVGWLNENLDFLRSTLSVEYILQKMQLAAKVLATEPEGAMATKIACDALQNVDVIAIRIEDMLDGLSLPEGGDSWN